MRKSGETTTSRQLSMWWLNQLNSRQWASTQQSSLGLRLFSQWFLVWCNLLLTIAFSYHIWNIQDTKGLLLRCHPTPYHLQLGYFWRLRNFSRWMWHSDSSLFARSFHSWCSFQAATKLAYESGEVFFRVRQLNSNFSQQLRFGRVKRGYFGIVGWGRAICTYYIGYMLYHIMLGGFSQLWEPKIQVVPELCTVNSNKVWEP